MTQRVCKRFCRSALIRLDHDAQRALLAGRGLRHELLERNHTLRRSTTLGLAVEALTALRNFARLDRVLDDDELIASHRDAADAEHLRGNRRTGVLDAATPLVEEGSHAA